MKTSPHLGHERIDASGSTAPRSDDPPSGQKIFRLDVAPNDVALMVRFRHVIRIDETQIRILAGLAQIREVDPPSGYVVDTIDVIGTRWDGQTSGGMHRVLCLLERKPDEKSELQHLIFVDQGDSISIPPVESGVRDLTDFRVIYAQGTCLLPP